MSPARPLILTAFHWYLEAFEEGATRCCREQGYEVAVLNSDTAAGFAGKSVAGIVGMLPADPAHPVRRLADRLGCPVVDLSLSYPEKTDWGRVPEDCEKVARIAAERLARLPARSFLFVDGGRWWHHDARWATFSGMLADDLRPCDRFHANGPEAEVLPRLAAHLLGMPRPVAVFGSVDEWAKIAHDAAELAHLRVPGDVFVLGFGNRELVSRLAPTPISSINIDNTGWAYAGAKLLTDMIAGRAAPGTVRVFAPGEIVERASTAGESGGDPLCGRAIALMRACVERPPGVPELAKRLGVSKATLDRVFVARLGETVARRFLKLRLEAAMARLAAGEKAGVAAAAAGFDSERGFSEAFKRETGLTPGAYAAKSREAGPVR